MKEIESGISAGVFDFRGNGLRSLTIEGVEWFVATDVCRILEIGHTPMALKRVENDDKFTLRRSEAVSIFDTLGVSPQVNQLAIVTESGLWKLVLSSSKPEAREFQQWITREVIPSIRRTGTYSVEGRALPQSFSEALRMLADEVEAHELAKAKINELTPKAAYHDAVMASPECLTMQEAALELGWTRNMMMAELREQKILMGNRLPFARYAHHFEVESVERRHDPGVFDQATRVKRSALPWLNRRLNGTTGVLRAVRG